MAVNSDNGWHLDRRVNVSVIATLVVLVAFVVGMDWRIKALEKAQDDQASVPMDIAVIKTEFRSLKDDVNDNSEQLDRIEEKIDRALQPPQ
jgi:septal ring factor EnvC (AmiA/AmiB activator)